MHTRTHKLTLTALMAAVISILSPWVIPVGIIPISLSNFAVCLAVIILGKKYSTICTALYLLIGFAGLPVFAGFNGGAGRLLGPTGGYLVGYLALTVIAGEYLDRQGKKDRRRQEEAGLQNPLSNRRREYFVHQLLALILGTLGLYFLGTEWLMLSAGLNLKAALLTGVLPFILPDVLKIIFAVWLGNIIKRYIPQMLG